MVSLQTQLDTVVHERCELQQLMRYLTDESVLEVAKRKWHGINSVDRLKRYHPVTITAENVAFIQLRLWKLTEKEPDDAKKLNQKIDDCTEWNKRAKEHLEQRLNSGFKNAFDNDWERLQEFPLEHPEVFFLALVALMFFGGLRGACH